MTHHHARQRWPGEPEQEGREGGGRRRGLLLPQGPAGSSAAPQGMHGPSSGPQSLKRVSATRPASQPDQDPGQGELEETAHTGGPPSHMCRPVWPSFAGEHAPTPTPRKLPAAPAASTGEGQCPSHASWRPCLEGLAAPPTPFKSPPQSPTLSVSGKGTHGSLPLLAPTAESQRGASRCTGAASGRWVESQRFESALPVLESRP